MHGIESIPLTLIAVSLLIIIVAYVGFTQVNVFLDFNTKRMFKEEMASFVENMKLIKAAGGQNTFSTKTIKIPSGGYTFNLDLTDDVVYGNLSGEIYNLSLKQISINLTAFRPLESGVIRDGIATLGGQDFKIVLHYGDLADLEIKNLTLTFE